MIKFFIITLICLFSIHGQRVVGYYPEWVRSTHPESNLNLDVLTHIIHSFAYPNSSGEILAPNNFYDISISNIIHDGGGKFLLGLGGWGQSDGFAPISESKSSREIFITNILELCDQYGYDGVDIDWEYPQNITEKNNLNLLVYEMDSIFYEHDNNLLITMAIPTSGWTGQWYDFNFLKNYVDFFNAMTYDYHGSWSSHVGHNSPLYNSPPSDIDGSCQSGINYLTITRQIPKNQLNMGIPFWGKLYNASNLNLPFDGNVVDKWYSEIAVLIESNNWNYYWDEIAKCPYLININEEQIITYDNTESIKEKCKYIKENELGGVMIWALGYDVVNGNQELINAINDNYLGNDNFSKSNTPIEFELKTFPNPFNPIVSIYLTMNVSEKVLVNIFNINGEEVGVLYNGFLDKGTYVKQWEPNSRPSGIYFIKINSGNFSKTKKIMLIK